MSGFPDNQLRVSRTSEYLDSLDNLAYILIEENLLALDCIWNALCT